MNKKNMVLKLSGEAVGDASNHFSPDKMEFIADEIVPLTEDFGIALVLGGGNISRGAEIRKRLGRESTASDYVGMLNTLDNGLMLQENIEIKLGSETTRVMSRLPVSDLCEPYIPRKALSHLAKGRIVIIVGGLGEPGFLTDFTMVQRAKQLHSPVALKGTKVDGIYDRDPTTDSSAQFIPKIKHLDYISRGLKVVDADAVGQAMKYGMEIKVFNFFKKGNLRRILLDENIGSVIHK